MARDLIIIGPNLGANPSITRCPICRKDTKPALLVKLKESKGVIRYLRAIAPCENCMKEYTTAIEVIKKQGGLIEPTGRAIYFRREIVNEKARDCDIVSVYDDNFQELLKQLEEFLERYNQR